MVSKRERLLLEKLSSLFSYVPFSLRKFKTENFEASAVYTVESGQVVEVYVLPSDATQIQLNDATAALVPLGGVWYPSQQSHAYDGWTLFDGAYWSMMVGWLSGSMHSKGWELSEGETVTCAVSFKIRSRVVSLNREGGDYSANG